MLVKCDECPKIDREENMTTCWCGKRLCSACHASERHDPCELAEAADTVELPVMPITGAQT
jgi:hypothetical protein